MGSRPQHSRAQEIARRGRELEHALLGVKSGAVNANSVVSGKLSLESDESKPGFFSRLTAKRVTRDYSAVGKLNENGTQLESLWVKEQDSNGRTTSTLLVRNLGLSGKIYEVTSLADGPTMEVVTEKHGALIYSRTQLQE